MRYDISANSPRSSQPKVFCKKVVFKNFVILFFCEFCKFLKKNLKNMVALVAPSAFLR